MMTPDDVPTMIGVPQRIDLARQIMISNDTASLMGVGLVLISVAACKDGETVLDSKDLIRKVTVMAELMISAHWDTFRKYEERGP